MNYQRNDQMEYLNAEEDKLVVFDPESGDTHFIDEVGRDILDILKAETSFERLVELLSMQYEADAGEIEADVKEFLNGLLEKKVVVCR